MVLTNPLMTNLLSPKIHKNLKKYSISSILVKMLNDAPCVALKKKKQGYAKILEKLVKVLRPPQVEHWLLLLTRTIHDFTCKTVQYIQIVTYAFFPLRFTDNSKKVIKQNTTEQNSNKNPFRSWLDSGRRTFKEVAIVQQPVRIQLDRYYINCPSFLWGLFVIVEVFFFFKGNSPLTPRT